MKKVGDEVEGYCSRCKLNVFMNIAATDGREIFNATCRTCHETVKYQTERSAEHVKAEAWKKLMRQKKRKSPRRLPEVVSRRKRGEVGFEEGEEVGEEGALAAGPKAEGVKEANLPKPTAGVTWGAPRKSIELEEKAKLPDDDPTRRWRELTAALGPRDGRPYYPDRTYEAGDVVLHKRHGMGIVESIVHENACMVLFRGAREVIEMGQAG